MCDTEFYWGIFIGIVSGIAACLLLALVTVWRKRAVSDDYNPYEVEK